MRRGARTLLKVAYSQVWRLAPLSVEYLAVLSSVGHLSAVSSAAPLSVENLAVPLSVVRSAVSQPHHSVTHHSLASSSLMR